MGEESSMSNKHKHFDAILAYANGAEIEYSDNGGKDWWASLTPCFFPEYGYRVKPHKWQACIDAQAAGKTIQTRWLDDVDGKWADQHCVFDNGSARSMEYRIKPETIKYRVALRQNPQSCGLKTWTDAYNGAAGVDIQGDGSDINSFVRWVSDVIEVTV
jgi:hypothetical protein